MTDKKENFEEEPDWRVIPTLGNEYPLHRKAKARVAYLMKELGFENIEFEKYLPFRLAAFVDVYGEYEGKKIAIEIDGRKGHSSERAYKIDRMRRQAIKSAHGVNVINLPVGNFDKKQMPDDTIKDELVDATRKASK